MAQLPEQSEMKLANLDSLFHLQNKLIKSQIYCLLPDTLEMTLPKQMCRLKILPETVTSLELT